MDSQRRRGRDALFRRLVVVRGRGTRARGRDARLGNAHAPSGPDAVVFVVVVVAVVVDGTDGVAGRREANSSSPLRFRTWSRVLSNRPLEETWGSTIRERWRRTYATEKPDGTRSTRLGLQMLASNKFRVVLGVFATIGGVPFVVFAAFGTYAAWKACVLITGLGIIGFVVVGKAIGAGEAAVGALASLAAAFEYATGFAAQDGLVSSLALLVTYRTSYYTLPVILFAYEELCHVARRLMRLSRW